MAVFTSAQDFFVSNSQSKKIELIRKPYVPRALRFSCQGPSRLREAKRAMRTRMASTILQPRPQAYPCAPTARGLPRDEFGVKSEKRLSEDWAFK